MSSGLIYHFCSALSQSEIDMQVASEIAKDEPRVLIPLYHQAIENGYGE